MGWFRAALEPLTYTVYVPVAVYFGLLIVESLFPGRRMPAVRGWQWKGILFFLSSALLDVVVPPILAPVGEHLGVFHVGALGFAVSLVLTVVLTDLVYYANHRLTHVIPFYWRLTHQMHHSIERVDIPGGVYFHPFDVIATIAVGMLVAAVIGAPVEVAIIANAISFILSLTQHVNIKTPRWVGLVLQRPEMHSIHHERGLHAFNYGNLAIWDMVFRTYRNPRSFSAEAGFYDGASTRIGAMLAFRDVGEPPAGVKE